MRPSDIIVVVDYGGQYTHLIARRVRQLRVYSEIVPYHASIERIIRLRPRGLILSGGPRSVYDTNAPKLDKRLLELGIP